VVAGGYDTATVIGIVE
jgi:hypothetical protein